MTKIIRIGTRSSELALWQATTVAKQIDYLGYQTEIVKIDSIGDIVLDKPLYELGITGVFTKNLDIALLNDKIDIAVHSLKDVPTKLPFGIVQAAVLKRGDFNDVLALKTDDNFFSNTNAIIATGSLRRKAQWLFRYPGHTITGLRGNVNTRLKKLSENEWNGAIFAMAGLKRVNLLPENHIRLDWMIPAPAQGAVMIAALEKNEDILAICKELNHKETEICVGIEREFLNKLEGGCTAPIGALATIKEEELRFKGVLFSPDGKNKIEFTKTIAVDKCGDLAEYAANYILDRGGKKIMREELFSEKEKQIFSTKTLSLTQKSKLSKDLGVSMSDFITIRYNRLKPVLVKEPIKNVIITSQNAVEALLNSFTPNELNFTNIYCVGRRTKSLIEKKIGKVSHVENSAESLAKYLLENFTDKEITFFTGNKRREELPEILAKKGIAVHEIECYKTILTPRKVDENVRAVLFYSPSGIESFLKENEANGKIAFCIGGTTAEEAKKHFNEVIIAKMSTIESVLSAVNKYFQEN